MATIKVAFRIFDLAPKNLQTHDFDNTHRFLYHNILLKIPWNCGSNAYHCGLKLFYDLQNYTELYEINWTLLLFHCAQVLWVHMACWHFTWALGERFEIGVLLMILIHF